MAQEKAAGSGSCRTPPSYFPEWVRSVNAPLPRPPGCPRGGRGAGRAHGRLPWVGPRPAPGSAPHLSQQRPKPGLPAPGFGSKC